MRAKPRSAHAFLLLPLLLLFSHSFSVDVASCGVINSPGTYDLTADLSGAPVSHPDIGVANSCIFINASDVTLDCHGHSITNDGTPNAAGITSNGTSGTPRSNVIVRNCQVLSDYERGIYLLYSPYSQITNNSVHNSTLYGISTSATNGLDAYTNITNNTVSDCLFGMRLYRTHHHFVADNTIYYTALYPAGTYVEYGMYFEESDYNNISNNNLSKMWEQGIHIDDGHNSSIEYNRVTCMNTSGKDGGIYLAYSDYNNVSLNTVTDCYNNFYLYESHYNLVFRNTAYLAADPEEGYDEFDNLRGIYLLYSVHNTIANNSINDSYYTGIYLSTSSNNSVENNTVYNSSQSGISVSGDENRVSYNTVYESGDDGIISSSTGNALNLYSFNEIFENGDIGLYSYGGSFELFFNNTVYNNSDEGVVAYWSDNCTFENNTVYNNVDDGLFLDYNAADNSFISNLIYDNGDSGVYIRDSADNNFTDNIIHNNTDYGVYFYFSSSSRSSQNNFSNGVIADNGYMDYFLDDSSYTQCSNPVSNVTGTNGHKMAWSNTTVVWNGIDASEIILCNAHNSVVSNISGVLDGV